MLSIVTQPPTARLEEPALAGTSDVRKHSDLRSGYNLSRVKELLKAAIVFESKKKKF
jgi:hypothetical protein